MSYIYLHYSWFLLVFFSFFRFLSFSVYLSLAGKSLYLSFSIFSSWFLDIEVSFFLDFISSWFSCIILLIRSIIMIYSYFYISPYSKSVYFLWITVLFILSILLVVLISDLLFLILGWDGLGLVSFFLIVYYQNQSSIISGVFTLLINRIGDRFFILSIRLSYIILNRTFSFSSNISSLMLPLFLILTFITKRALFPFSPWLPIAIAAPTPISALVHSSTLVTAGLYLIMRFSYIIYRSYHLIVVLSVLSVFTSFYAGINTIFEKDLKKLIALSTLSHLGFIGIAFSSGLLYLSFFHMLTHALFKSLLFISIGDIITNLNHSQDIRYLSSGINYTPFSCIIIYISLLNLLGLPNLSGFFSKDLILESINYSSFSIFLNIFIFLNVFFTYYYTYQLFYFSFQSNKLNPYQLIHYPTILHSSLLVFLGLSSLVFGFFFLYYSFNISLFPVIPITNKLLPIFLNIFIFSILFLNSKLFTFNNKIINLYFSRIIFLSPLMLTVFSNLYFSMSFSLAKSTEYGALNYTFNSYLRSLTFQISSFFFNLSITQPIKITLFSFLLCFLFIFF